MVHFTVSLYMYMGLTAAQAHVHEATGNGVVPVTAQSRAGAWQWWLQQGSVLYIGGAVSCCSNAKSSCLFCVVTARRCITTHVKACFDRSRFRQLHFSSPPRLGIRRQQGPGVTPSRQGTRRGRYISAEPAPWTAGSHHWPQQYRPSANMRCRTLKARWAPSSS